MKVNITPETQVNILSFVVNLDVHFDLRPFSFSKNKTTKHDDSKRYGGALSSRSMKHIYCKTFDKRCYNQQLFPGYQLPYLIEMKFFKQAADDQEFVDFNNVVVKHTRVFDWEANLHKSHSFYTPGFLDRVRKSFEESKRRWDETNSTNQIRIGKVDINNKSIEVGKTSYNSQVLSNLSMDLPRTEKSDDTLRSITAIDGGPPPLDFRGETKLANSLGIAILFFYKDEHGGWVPLVPLRDNVSVFKNEWGCSSSFAARWDSIAHLLQEGQNPLSYLATHLLIQHINWELKIIPDNMINLIPLALTRELFRGGKPQLFFAGFTTLTRREILERIDKADHKEEVKQKAPLLQYLTSDKFVLMDSKNQTTHRPSIEYMMNASLLNDYKSFKSIT